MKRVIVLFIMLLATQQRILNNEGRILTEEYSLENEEYFDPKRPVVASDASFAKLDRIGAVRDATRALARAFVELARPNERP